MPLTDDDTFVRDLNRLAAATPPIEIDHLRVLRVGRRRRTSRVTGIVLATAIGLTGAGLGVSAFRSASVSPVRPAGTAAPVEPVNVLTYWRDHPESVPADAEGATTVLDVVGQGATSYTIPASTASSTYVIVLTCTGDSDFQVSTIRSTNSGDGFLTGANSCAGPPSYAYTSPAGSPGGFRVDVPAGVAFNLVVLERVSPVQPSP